MKTQILVQVQILIQTQMIIVVRIQKMAARMAMMTMAAAVAAVETIDQNKNCEATPRSFYFPRN